MSHTTTELPQIDPDLATSYESHADIPFYKGGFEWDHWKLEAIKKGMNPDLAQLGRDVMREAHNHHWRAYLQIECRWDAMLEFGLDDPAIAQKRWEHLLQTDGEIVRFDPETGEMIYLG